MRNRLAVTLARLLVFRSSRQIFGQRRETARTRSKLNYNLNSIILHWRLYSRLASLLIISRRCSRIYILACSAKLRLSLCSNPSSLYFTTSFSIILSLFPSPDSLYLIIRALFSTVSPPSPALARGSLSLLCLLILAFCYFYLFFFRLLQCKTLDQPLLSFVFLSWKI